jgi:hypothetical protein
MEHCPLPTSLAFYVAMVLCIYVLALHLVILFVNLKRDADARLSEDTPD